ncbi:MAG: orotate phosphoribosyltransferase [Gammaproteobacteria bacterium]|nr:orotate phosphoribosyltransferase [Gammaproteobacteria bacterium]
MADYKKGFIEFALDHDVLRFGEFDLKSGRKSPYFFNAGEFKTGGALARLGSYYAEVLVASGLAADCLFGPAYKGIPLVAATSIAMANQYQIDMPYVFNRKEAKSHGEGGTLVGARLEGNVVIVDDVITAGTAIREVMSFFGDSQKATASAVIVAIDRQERGKADLSAIQEVERDYGLRVLSVVTLNDIVQFLEENGAYKDELKAISSYHAEYGIASF